MAKRLSGLLIGKVKRLVSEFVRTSNLLSPLRIDRAVEAQSVSGGSIQNLRTLVPAEARVSLGASENEGQFLRIGKYYKEGYYARPGIFVCEVPGAFYHVGTGLVCTRKFDAISDSLMTYRLPWCPLFKWFKPLRVQRLPGTYGTINNLFWKFWWHWLFDCLPRLHSLEQAYPDQKIVLLMPDEMGESHRESLASALPSNFEVKYLPAKSWVKVDKMLLPSYASGRCNGHLPPEYVESIRRRVFARYGLPSMPDPVERIYVSRAHAPHRRVVNEVQLVELLQTFGFRSVVLERLDFRQQVELFHRAQVIVAAEGSSVANVLFAGKIKVLVLYPDPSPRTNNFTTVKALGQEHFFVAGEHGPDSDFAVDLTKVENVLRNEMRLG